MPNSTRRLRSRRPLGRGRQAHQPTGDPRGAWRPPAERIHASRGGCGSLKVTTRSNPTTPTGADTMNTITTTASTSVSILAIDLGKYKSVACLHDHASGEVRFTTVETTRAELRKLLD